MLFFAIEAWFGATGVWYLVGLGATALLFALFLPAGLWGWVEQRRFGLPACCRSAIAGPSRIDESARRIADNSREELQSKHRGEVTTMLFGKTIVVTGVSSGIGARTAELAAAARRRRHRRRCPRRRLARRVDLLHPGRSLVRRRRSTRSPRRLPPRIDALCNVAGVSGTLGAAKTLAINFYGLRALSEAARAAPARGRRGRQRRLDRRLWLARQSRARQGAWSTRRAFPTPALAGNHAVNDAEGYPVSKEALLLWTQRAAHQPLFKDRGIRVNAVSPGPVATPILPEFRAVFGDARVDGDIARVGRAGTPADIAPAILFLCSDGARWINGANLAVDGGLEAAVNAGTMGF